MSVQSKPPVRSDLVEIQSNFKAGLVSLDSFGQEQFNKDFTYLVDGMNFVGSKGGSLVTRQGFRLVLSTDLKNPDIFYLSDAGELWVAFWTSVPTPKMILVPNPDDLNPKHLEFNFTFPNNFILNDQVIVSSSTKGSLTLVSNDLVKFKIKNETEVEVENLTKLNTIVSPPNMIITNSGVTIGIGAICDIEFIDPVQFAYIKSTYYSSSLTRKPYKILDNSGNVLKTEDMIGPNNNRPVDSNNYRTISTARNVVDIDPSIKYSSADTLQRLSIAGVNLNGKFKIKNFTGLIYDNVEKKHKRLLTGEILFSGTSFSSQTGFDPRNIIMKLPTGVTLDVALSSGTSKLDNFRYDDPNTNNPNIYFNSYYFSSYVGNDINLNLNVSTNDQLNILATRIDTSALTDDTQTDILHLTTAMLIHNQRAYVVLDDKVIYSEVGKYDDFKYNTSTKEFGNSVLLDGVSRCNAIIPFKDGIVFSRADGIRFFRIDVQQLSGGTAVNIPYLSKELDVSALDDGLIEISGKFMIVTKTSLLMAIVATRGDLFFSGDQLPTFLGVVDLSQKASHIFAEGIELIRPIRRLSSIGVKGIILKTMMGNHYIVSVNVNGENNSPDISFFEIGFGTSVKLSDGNGDLILTQPLKTNIAIAEYPIGFNKDYFIDFSIFYKNIKSHFLDFFTFKEIERVLVGYLTSSNNNFQFPIFNIDTSRSIGGIPQDISGRMYVLKNTLNSTKYIALVSAVLPDNQIALNLIDGNCCLYDMGKHHSWLLIGEYKQIEQSVIDSYKTSFSGFSILMFDGVKHHLVNSVEYDPKACCVAYVLGIPYDQHFTTFTDGLPYDIMRKRMRVFGFGFKEKCFELRKQLGFREEIQVERLEDHRNCMYRDVQVMNNMAVSHLPNIETTSFHFDQGIFSAVSKIVYHFEVIK